ncbi:MAG: hypothetical protein R3F34_17265 [Planctomycetota bacterium]
MTELEEVGAIAIVDGVGPQPRVAGLPPASGMFPGLCVLADGRWVVQTAGLVHLVDPIAARNGGSFEPARLVQPTLGEPPFPTPASDAPGWRFEPATDGRSILVVDGRALARPPTSKSNLLARITPPPPRTGNPALDDSLLARVDWALSFGGRLRVDGSVEPAPELAGVEFQPGPRLVDRTAVVQTRRGGTDEFEAALLGLDWVDGGVRFERTLAIGDEIGHDLGRFASAVARGAGSPLAVDGTRVLVTTNLGVLALVDAIDGRLVWSLRHQRRDVNTSPEGPTGVRAAFTKDRAYVAPADSDLVHVVPTGPWPGADVAALREPLDRGETLFLGSRTVAGGTTRLLVALRAGSRQALGLLDPQRAETVPGVFLPQGEGLCEGLWCSADGRFAIASGERHVYLFDLERELFLLDQHPLDDPRAPRDHGRSPALGGSVHVAGSRIGVLSADALILFTPRR